ncbi:MAG: hypothetical protein QOE45_1686 [Frankiaceae bacterium]|jgi:hypothetical protein|nr:hypothetical protein [Frankiaceae bacterium]
MRRLLVATVIAAAAFGAGSTANAAPACKDLPAAAGYVIGACLPGFTCQDLCTWNNADLHCRHTGKAALAVDACQVIDKL